MPDAIVVGSGPNGLAAAIVLARAGLSVGVLEAEDDDRRRLPLGRADAAGVRRTTSARRSTRSRAASPFLRSVPLEEHGVEWVQPPAALAHPFDDGTRGAARALGRRDRGRSRRRTRGATGRLMAPLVERPRPLLERSARAAPRCPRTPRRWRGSRLHGRAAGRACSRGERSAASGRAALFAGLAAHSMLPLTRLPIGGVRARARRARARGRLAARAGRLAADRRRARRLPRVARRRDRDGPPVALARRARRRRAGAARRHAAAASRARGRRAARRATARRLERLPLRAGRLQARLGARRPDPLARGGVRARGDGPSRRHARGDRRAPSGRRGAGAIAERPFVLLAQQSLFDPSRAPAGKHTAWAYCHVPNGSPVDMTERIEAQVERFAPGFRELDARALGDGAGRRSRRTTRTTSAATSTAVPRTFGRRSPGRRFGRRRTRRRFRASSSARPRRRPGGGVHGMCGFHAARAALRAMTPGGRSSSQRTPLPFSGRRPPRCTDEIRPSYPPEAARWILGRRTPLDAWSISAPGPGSSARVLAALGHEVIASSRTRDAGGARGRGSPPGVPVRSPGSAESIRFASEERRRSRRRAVVPLVRERSGARTRSRVSFAPAGCSARSGMFATTRCPGSPSSRGPCFRATARRPFAGYLRARDFGPAFGDRERAEFPLQRRAHGCFTARPRAEQVEVPRRRRGRAAGDARRRRGSRRGVSGALPPSVHHDRLSGGSLLSRDLEGCSVLGVELKSPHLPLWSPRI